MAYALSQFTQTPTSFSGGIEIRAHVEPNAAQTGGVGFFLPTGTAGATATGYMFVFDPRSGQYPGQIFKMTAGALVALTSIQAKGATNAAALSGVHMLLARYHFNTKKFEIWIDGVLQYVGTDSVYTLAGPIAYGGYLATGGFISQVTVNGHSGIHPDNKDPNDKAYIDFTQAGHTGKNLDNIPDGSARKLSAAAGHITTIFPSAVVDASGGYIDVTNVQAAGTALPGTAIQSVDAWSGNTRIVITFKVPAAGNLNLFFFDPSNNAYVVQVGAIGVTIRKSTAAGAITNPTIYSGDYTATDFSNTTRTIAVQFHSNGKIAVHIGGVQRVIATETLYTFNGGIGYALEAAGTGFIYKVLIEGHTAIHPDNQDSATQRALIDFTHLHVSKHIGNLADGTDPSSGVPYARHRASGLDSGITKKAWTKHWTGLTVDTTDGNRYSPAQRISAPVTTTSSAVSYNGDWELSCQIELGTGGAFEIGHFIAIPGNGYLFQVIQGSTGCQILSWNGSAFTFVGAANDGPYLANVVHNVVFKRHRTGHMEIYFDGALHLSVLDTTYTTASALCLSWAVTNCYVSNVTVRGHTDTPYVHKDSTTKRALIDFTHLHVSKHIGNVADGTDPSSGIPYARTKGSALKNGVPSKELLHMFPTATLDDDGIRLDVLNAIGP